MVPCPAPFRFVCSVVVVLALAGGFVPARGAAQERAAIDADVRRSAIIQAAIAHIEANRAEFVRSLLMEWTSHVDAGLYDLFETLGPIAMRAPAWQLYGASLVGDFPTMVRVLRGEEGAGAHVNALAEQPAALQAYDPAWEVVEPDDLGSTTDNLVYTPIAPCRVVDTRGAGARTGIIPANGTRTFDLTTAAFTSGQGGAGPCAGLPAFAHAAWAVNVTVTGYGGVGWLKAWGFGGSEPAASIINYSPGQAALANGLILTGCYGCADDITVKAFTSGTHVIIDVIGYFRQAQIASAVTTRVAGTPVSVPAGGGAVVQGGFCPAGTQLVGGEVSHPGEDTTIAEFNHGTGSWWFAYMINREAVARTVTVFSRCRDAVIRFP